MLKKMTYFTGYEKENTHKALLIKEKEFVYNLWALLNPRTEETISNAVLYDVLLILIYNVNAPLQSAVAYFNEYLEKFYREQGVDFTGIDPCEQSIFDEPPSLHPLNHYLEENNTWTLEKLASEFKAAHANKVASEQQNYHKSNRSFSPLPLTEQGDPRKYRSRAVLDHCSQFTFSPKLQKTS